MVVKVTYFDSVIVREDGAGISLGFRLEFRRQVKVGEDGVAFSWCSTSARPILSVRARRRKAGMGNASSPFPSCKEGGMQCEGV
jgi:hypothetical protein